MISRLGTPDSRLSNISLGAPPGHIFIGIIGTVIRIAARYSPTLPAKRR